MDGGWFPLCAALLLCAFGLPPFNQSCSPYFTRGAGRAVLAFVAALLFLSVKFPWNFIIEKELPSGFGRGGIPLSFFLLARGMAPVHGRMDARCLYRYP